MGLEKAVVKIIAEGHYKMFKSGLLWLASEDEVLSRARMLKEMEGEKFGSYEAKLNCHNKLKIITYSASQAIDFQLWLARNKVKGCKCRKKNWLKYEPAITVVGREGRYELDGLKFIDRYVITIPQEGIEEYLSREKPKKE